MHPTRSDPLARFRDAAAARAAAGLKRALRPRAPGDPVIDVASNDYLGLARDPRPARAAAEAAIAWGTGSTGSRLVTGSTTLHAELEEALRRFAGAPAALVFSSGYLANLAAVTVLSGRGTLVVSDEGNHASIVDACRLSRARVVVTPHKDVTAVEKALADRDEEHALVVTDSVFSVDGDLAPIAALHAAAVRQSALLLVDEAHAMGVVGEGGRGAVHAAGLAGDPRVVRTLTLSKSFGSQGGAVLGPPEVIDALVDTGRPFIFDTGLAPACAAAALAAVRIVEGAPELPGRARSMARELGAMVTGLGLPDPGLPAGAVVPVVLGRPQVALRAVAICADHGVRAGCFRPPSVPEGRSCLRLTARADLGCDDLAVIKRALTAVSELKVNA
ncbi:8-amino-7-oxononanoate synthase [Spongiactinospora gelatinilytica]|uniref:8-amino-7-oxononanoate synthase n=1 Tax=Spongiactinospora gelatinilytica TaxID=2666298 RepID=A0A2W2FY65_9ACTN|nr:8-amino-7-oxononanoate synthase [Spongiactinospora gelatinilytica]